MIYLDNNASTKVDPEAAAAVAQAMELSGNPSSVHAEGRRARRAVEKAISILREPDDSGYGEA